MVALVSQRLNRLLRIDFIRFCIVGGVGFSINLILLTLLTKTFHLPIVLAQLIGSEIALFSNFIMHHYWTYKHKKVTKNLKTLILQFHATSWPAILGSTAMVTVGVNLFHFNKLLALVVSSVVALAWNFAWSKYVIWRNVTEQEIEDIAA